MSSGSDQHSSSPRREHPRSTSRSRSREKRNERQHRDRERERKIKIKVPELTAPLSNFKHFCYLQIEKLSTQTLQRAYDRYKKDWEHRQNEEFLKEYKKDAWFSEKYDPEVLDLLERDRKDNSKNQHADFIKKFNIGFYDKIDLTVKDPNELGIVEKFEEDEQNNSGMNYVLSQAFDVHVNPQKQIHNEPFFGFDQDLYTLFIKSVPRAISRYDIRTVVQKLQGYKALTMSDPVKKANLTRYCWIDFQTEETCNKAALSLSGLMIKNETLVVTKSTTKIKRIKILKNYPLSRMEKDINTLGRLIAKLDSEVGIECNQLLCKQFGNPKNKMDIFLLYLRKVHAYDYFTSTSYQNQRILALKVSSAFLRIEADYEELENVQTVFKKIQQKAEERIQSGNPTRDYMAILRDQIENFIRETQKLTKDQQKQVWKCLYCDKKFKTCQFLSKHMIAKHEEIKFKKIQTVMERLYLQDPQKITFASLGDRQQRFKRPYNPNFRRDKRREYRDFDEPENQKGNKPSGNSNKQMINFLDI